MFLKRTISTINLLDFHFYWSEKVGHIGGCVSGGTNLRKEYGGVLHGSERLWRCVDVSVWKERPV